MTILRSRIRSNYVPLKEDASRRIMTKRVPVVSPSIGYSTVHDGWEDFSYRVEINWEEVKGMAHRAAASKGGKAQQGPIRVVITGRRKVG